MGESGKAVGGSKPGGIPEQPVPGSGGAGVPEVFPPSEIPGDTLPSSHPDAGEISRAELDFLRQELGPDLEFLGVLGRGRAATVYLAREVAWDRLVAVKVLSRDLSDDPVAKARFQREGQAAASLSHPNAVTVYRPGLLSNHVPFQVMQYVKGRTLEDRLAAEGPLSQEEARRVLGEIAGALSAAHNRGFVHRDLRPGNILCDEVGCRVLVSDFGLAGILPHARETQTRLTRVGEVLSNPRYASPELLKGEELTEGADIYALGVIGYELLAGEGPFATRTDRDLAMAHLRAPPRPLASLRPGIDPGLAALLERCLAKEPGRRPTAASLAKAFKESAGSRPLTEAADQEDPGLLQALLRRRLPQIVVLTAGVGWGFQELVSNGVQSSVLPKQALPLAWNTVIGAVLVAWIVAWYHGQKGKQRVTPVEVALLALVALGWLVAGVLIIWLM
jgi:serine/threonine protein kinase